MMQEPTHSELMRALGTLEGKLDTLIADHKEHRESDRELHGEMDDAIRYNEKRIRAVERKQSWTAGALAAITAVGGAVIGLFKHGGGT